MSRAEAAALLGVAPDAAPPDVQRAFLRAARHAHPDTRSQADADAAGSAGARFDALTRARAALMVPAPPTPEPLRAPSDDGWAPAPGEPDGPRYRPVRGRGLSGSLVVLALLAFLLVALVSLTDAYRQQPIDQPAGPPGVTAVP